ncbi:IclR family transcriptional regulator domain-containing protein [Streptomyces sp. NPDC055681]
MHPARYPTHATASGKVLLAALEPEQRRVLGRDELRCFTPFTVTSPRWLSAELHRVREHEIAVSREELPIGVMSVAVPVGPIFTATTAMSVSGLVGQIRPDHIARSLRRAAAQSWELACGLTPRTELRSPLTLRPRRGRGSAGSR